MVKAPVLANALSTEGPTGKDEKVKARSVKGIS
jgi:hypothetical protein